MKAKREADLWIPTPERLADLWKIYGESKSPWSEDIRELLTGLKEARAGSSLDQEYGQDHPWKQFDRWHEEFHRMSNRTLPCRIPLRCFWRWTRKTGVIIDQTGVVERDALQQRDEPPGAGPSMKTAETP